MKKQVASAVLATALVAELIAPVAKPSSVVQASTPTKIEQVLQQLSVEQRRAIQDLTQTSTTGLQLSPETDLASEEEISVIIEFNNKPAKTATLIEKLNGRELALEEAEKLVEDDHAVFKHDLDSLGIKGKISTSYKQVYNGVAMTLPANEVKNLLKSKAVKNVWENQVVQLDDPSTSVEQGTAATSAYTGKHPHESLGVDKLHKEGYTGKGVKIAVLDSGIDYNHPDLKDAFKGGYDFVDNDNDPMETTYEDWLKSGKPENNGRTYWTDHGTHVSGIIAGQQKSDAKFATKGVAPDADLYVYRVLGPYGSGSEENIISGIEQAVKDKMDVINLSLGNTYNSPFEPSAVAINNAVLDGVTAVLAAGNTGSALYTVGSPAASPLAITVGSTNTQVALPGFMGTFKSASKQGIIETRYCTTGFGIDARLLKGQTIEVVDANLGKETDYDSINVKDKIALVSTGDLTINQKVAIAKVKGATAVLIYDKWGPGYISDTLQELPAFVPTQIITTAQGKEIKELLKTGPVSFTFDEVKEKVTAMDDTLSLFSSRGPARSTYDIKPEIVAPGGSIMSTVSGHYRKDYLGNYDYAYDKFSGTSMASPHVAGIAALLLQANPKLSPGEVKSSLMNTADAIQSKDSVYEVGAGRVDAYEAVHAVTSFKVADETLTLFKNEKEKSIKEITGSLSFGTVYASDNAIEELKEIEIENRSSQEQLYDVKVNYQAVKGSLNAVENGVVLETASLVTVKAGGKESLSTKMIIPSTAKNGTYEGYVTFTNKDNAEDTYQIPFAIRKVKYGVDSVNMTTSLTTIQENGITTAIPSIQGSFKLSSHMKAVDLFLTNAVTGEEMGFVGNFDGTWIKENQSVTAGFSGSYYPFTNDKENPVSYESQMAEQGSYKLKFVFTDDQGNETTIEKPFIIDNETPTIETELEAGIVETDPALTVISVKGKIHDKQIEDMVALGLQAKQGNNMLYYRYNNNPYGQQYPAVDEMGNFNYSTNFPSAQKVLPISLYSTDKAGLPSLQKEFIFVKKGSNYISTVADKKEVKTGEVINFISKANNSTSWKEAKWNYQFNKDYLALESIEVSEELKGKVSLETTETSNGISVTLKALQESISANEKLPLLNVKAKVKDDKFINTYVALAVTNPTYTDANGAKTFPAVAQPSVRVWPKYSRLQGDMNGEAVYYRDGYGQLKTTYVNYFALGATIKVKDDAGNTYEGKVINDAKFIIDGLPTDRKPLTFVFDVPGHFTVEKTFTIGREGVIGELHRLNFKSALAGDVNKDNLIDIDDAVYLNNHWKTSDRTADLNFDGIVDMKDMDYIKKNYLQENPTVKADKTPKQNANGKTLEEIISELN